MKKKTAQQVEKQLNKNIIKCKNGCISIGSDIACCITCGYQVIINKQILEPLIIK